MGAIRYSCPIRLVHYNFLKFFFPIIPMGSCPIRLVPTYILPEKERRLLGKFQPNRERNERLVCVETDGQTARRRDGQTVRRTWLDRLV